MYLSPPPTTQLRWVPGFGRRSARGGVVVFASLVLNVALPDLRPNRLVTHFVGTRPPRRLYDLGLRRRRWT